eukprot:scaffold544839_cov16-Prasinocladus_malaysianus.AAC.1
MICLYILLNGEKNAKASSRLCDQTDGRLTDRKMEAGKTAECMKEGIAKGGRFDKQPEENAKGQTVR